MRIRRRTRIDNLWRAGAQAGRDGQVGRSACPWINDDPEGIALLGSPAMHWKDGKNCPWCRGWIEGDAQLARVLHRLRRQAEAAARAAREQNAAARRRLGDPPGTAAVETEEAPT